MLTYKSSGSIDSQIEAKIRQWEEQLDPKDHVMIEGGHFTVNVHEIWLPVVLISKPDTVYLLDLEIEAPQPPNQIFYAREKNRCLSIVRPSQNETVDLRGWPGLTRVREIKFHPSKTEKESFRLAVEAVQRLKTRVEKVVAALFIGDIGLPTVVKDFVREGALIPESYRRELEHCSLAGELFLFLESVCRNRGKERVLDRAKREDENQKEEIYRQYGYTIFPYRNIYSLAGDFFIDRERFPLIPLTKNEQNTPTCALILAGKYIKMAREGVTEVLAIYDKRDDAEIRIKNWEGLTIAAYNLGDHPMNCTLITVDDLSREPVLVDRLSVREVTHGERRFMSSQHLMSIAQQRTHSAAAEQCSQDTCSVQRHRQI
jgi:hypothetical protein